MRMKTQRILAALLSLILLLALAPAGWAVDLTTPNTVEINLVSQQDYAADIVKADITVDFYLIAVAEPVTGYDTYSLKVKDAYKDLSVKTTGEQGGSATSTLAAELEKQINAETPSFDEIVETLSKAVLENDGPTPDKFTPSSTNVDKITASGLPAGMYLMVPHGTIAAVPEITAKRGDTGYVKTITTGEGTAALTLYRTRAFSEDYEYTFKPQLVTVPGKEIKTGEGSSATSVPKYYKTDEGTWTNTVPVVVKVERESRYGDLKIVKTLTTFAGPDPASFVFKITWGNEERYAEITFEADGTKEYTLLKEIPVGTSVTVTEVHTGRQYTGAPTGDTTVTIVALDAQDAPATVGFTNDHSGPGGGYGAVNRFDIDAFTMDDAMEQLPDSGSTTPSTNNQPAPTAEGEE